MKLIFKTLEGTHCFVFWQTKAKKLVTLPEWAVSTTTFAGMVLLVWLFWYTKGQNPYLPFIGFTFIALTIWLDKRIKKFWKPIP